jgi:Cu/Ag efflux protein CusF
MRKLAFASALVASLAVSAAALAAAVTATGTITAIDVKAETVTIDKAVYVFPAKFDLSKVKVGEKVTITYEVKNGKNDATKIEAAK